MPAIVVDTREQRPFAFAGLVTVRRKLDYGDYSLRGSERAVAVERKSLADLFGTVVVAANRMRFERELEGAALDGTRLWIVVEASPERVAAGLRWSRASGARVLSVAFSLASRWGHGLTFAGGRRGAEMVALAALRGWWELETGAR